MTNVISPELLGIFIICYIIYKFNLEKKFISLLFKNHVIYLPLTNDDFNQLMELTKENKLNKTQNKLLIRSCQFEEYAEKTKTPSFIDFDFTVLLYLCNFIIIVFYSIYEILCFFILGERGPFLIENETNKTENVDNSSDSTEIHTYMIISFIFYIIYREISKSIFEHSFIGKNAKDFYFSFVMSTALFFVNEYYNESLFKLNYESVIKIIQERIDIILSKTTSNIDFNIQKIHIKIFFSFIFGLFSAVVFRMSQIEEYFFTVFCSFSNSINSHNEFHPQEKDHDKKNNKLEYFAKIKSIINLIIILLLLEPSLDNFLQVVNLNKIYIKLILIYILLGIEFVLGFFILWHAYLILCAQNYQEIMRFVMSPNKQYLEAHQKRATMINENIWKIINHLFIYCFLPLYIFLCYMSEIKFVERVKKNNNDNGFNKGFLDNIFFVIFIALQISKGIVENSKFYYDLIMKNKNNSLY